MAKQNTAEEIAQLQSLLKNHNNNPLVGECLGAFQEDNVLFKSSEKKSKENSKENLLLAYQIKASWENNRSEVEKTTIGFNDLLTGIAGTKAKHIKITEFTGSKATFFIFSNFEISEFIGILKSNQTLGDIESKLKRF